MTHQNPAIVVIGFDRPKSIQRLLSYLALADYPDQDVTLVISLDHSTSDGGRATQRIANEFDWQHGPKRLIQQTEFLGLRDHVLRCGDLVDEFESVIVLEDDLSVCPNFYRFAFQAMQFSLAHQEIAGISLYSQRTNKSAMLPFMPIYDGFDNFYLQVAASWGQLWHRDQWRLFRKWYDALEQREPGSMADIPATAPIPEDVRNWSRFSWLKYFIWYLMDTERYFLYPRMSFSTNHSDRGTHNATASKAWQVPLAMRIGSFRFSSPQESLAKYDAYYELHAACLREVCPVLAKYDLTVDLYGNKQRFLLDKPWVLTSRKTTRSAELSFPLERKPLEANFLRQVEPAANHTFSLISPEHTLDASTIQISSLATVRYFFNVVPVRDIIRNAFGYFRQRKRDNVS